MQLNAPTISLSGSTLSITDGNNGSFSENFEIYSNNELKAVVSTSVTSYNLTAIITTTGTYSITVKSSGTGMITSAPSNAVSYSGPTVYTITTNITNGTIEVPGTIREGETNLAALITANTGYDAPADATVTGCTHEVVPWGAGYLALKLSYPTGNVTITATCTAQSTPLDAPSVSLSDDVVTLTDNDGNATGFKVYFDNTYEETITK